MIRNKAYKFFMKRCFSQDLKDNLFFSNPLDKLQKHLVKPLFKENEFYFNPSLQKLKFCHQLFTPSKFHNMTFLKGVGSLENLPKHQLSEVAFIGRSNVGKSSLIKAMFSSSSVDVRTSKKPGHTKTLNFFSVGKSFCLVDIPGYGINQPPTFNILVKEYLKTSKNLRYTFFLMECGSLWSEHDNIAIDMLNELKIPFAIVVTKIDLQPDSIQLKDLMLVLNFRKRYMLNSAYPQPFLCSSTTSEGIGFLQAFIGSVTSCIPDHVK